VSSEHVSHWIRQSFIFYKLYNCLTIPEQVVGEDSNFWIGHSSRQLSFSKKGVGNVQLVHVKALPEHSSHGVWQALIMIR